MEHIAGTRILSHIQFNTVLPPEGFAPICCITKKAPESVRYCADHSDLELWDQGDIDHFEKLGFHYKVAGEVTIAPEEVIWLKDDGTYWIARKDDLFGGNALRQLFLLPPDEVCARPYFTELEPCVA